MNPFFKSETETLHSSLLTLPTSIIDVTSSRLQLKLLHQRSRAVRSGGLRGTTRPSNLLYGQHLGMTWSTLADDERLKIIFREAVTCKFPLRSPSHCFIGGELSTLSYISGEGNLMLLSFRYTRMYRCNVTPCHHPFTVTETMGEAVSTKNDSGTTNRCKETRVKNRSQMTDTIHPATSHPETQSD